MKFIPFERLYNTDFQILEPIAKAQWWAARGNVYDALHAPKISHTLLWFKNCRARITDARGNELEIRQNQLTYMSKASQYRVDFLDTNADREDTVVIHFQMVDSRGEDIIPTLTPIVGINDVGPSFSMDIDNLVKEFEKNIVCLPEAKAVIYKLMAIICQKQKKLTTKNRYDCIRNGIELLEKNSSMSLSEISDACGVSECYFRRLFKEYSGKSPIQFLQHHRIERAKQLLLSEEEYSIGEIAQMLDFSDIYHFSKTFKKLCGISPMQFMQNGHKTNRIEDAQAPASPDKR